MGAAAENAAENTVSRPKPVSCVSSRIPYSDAFGLVAENVEPAALPHDSANARGGDPLGSPPRDTATGFAALPVSRIQQQGDAPAGRGPLAVASTPEFIASVKAFYETWTANETDGQKAHAKKRSTVFSIMQYRNHPETDAPLWTREQWDELIAKLDEAGVLERHAAIWHDKDTLPDGRPKKLHFHGVIRLLPGAEKQVRYLAIRAHLPASRVRTPRDSYAEGKVVTGPLAADLAFYDFCEYLVHEDERSREEEKYEYPRDEVFSNFDFAGFLDAGRPAAAKRERRFAKQSPIDALAMEIQAGLLTLRQARQKNPLAYNRAKRRMMDSRDTYLLDAKMDSHRTNYYFGGPSGTGKSFTALMFVEVLASMLYPHLAFEEAVFSVGRKGVEFQKYDGQPIVVWDDFRVGSIIGALGGTRDSVWAALDVNPNRLPVYVNKKFGDVRLLNAVNIFTGIESYSDFLENLAGNYRDKDGNEHDAEDPVQAYRRMPFVAEVTAETVTFYLNKGFASPGSSLETFRVFESFAVMQANMGQIARTLDAMENEEERDALRLEAGHAMLGKMLDAHQTFRPPKTLGIDDARAQIMGSVEVLTGDDLAAHETDVAIGAAELAAAERTERELDRIAQAEARQLCKTFCGRDGKPHAPWGDPCPYRA